LLKASAAQAQKYIYTSSPTRSRRTREKRKGVAVQERDATYLRQSRREKKEDRRREKRERVGSQERDATYLRQTD
jgi:hypothetical protein